MNTSPPRKLSRTVDKYITEDWRLMLPGLSVYRPRWFLRRVGPLLVGVCLDRDSSGEDYQPCVHVHFLGRASDFIALTLCTQLKSRSGGPKSVRVRWHKEQYVDAASRLIQQSPLPLAGPVTLDQVIQAYRNAMLTFAFRHALEYADLIVLLAWGRREGEAREVLEEAFRELTGERAFLWFDGREGFERTMRGAIEDPDSINRTVEAEIVAHRLEGICSSELIC